MVQVLRQTECFDAARKGKHYQELKIISVCRNVFSVFENLRVMIYFRNTGNLLPFHSSSSSILLQGQENQREKGRS